MSISKRKQRIALTIIAALLLTLVSVSLVSAQTVGTKDKVQVQRVIENYYADSYDMWMNLKMGDLSLYLDLESVQSYNKTIALEEMIEKWKYAIEKSYFKGIREKHDIYFKYNSIEIAGDNAVVKVVLSGETSGMPAYPMFVSFGENIFNLRRVGDSWLIYRHDYTDLFLYERSKTEKFSYSIENLRKQIDEENASMVNDNSMQLKGITISSFPFTDFPYSSSRAVNYANAFVHSNNPYFYATGLNCTNFVSQAVSYGFGTTTGYSTATSYRMVPGTYTSGWFAGSGGGSGPWESVTHHWNYMISSKINLNGPRVTTTTWTNLLTGGVVQIDFNSDGIFDHSAICVDRASEKFAQNTPNGYRFHREYGAGPKRYYNPSFFRVH